MKAPLAAVLLAAAAAACTPAQDPAPAPAPAAAPAPAPAPAAAAQLNPVGRYEFVAQVQGSEMKGVVTIAGAPGAYTGTLLSDMFPPMSVSRVTVTGRTLTFVAEAQQGPATLTFNFTGDDFTGTWALGDSGGNVSGKRLPAQ